LFANLNDAIIKQNNHKNAQLYQKTDMYAEDVKTRGIPFSRGPIQKGYFLLTRTVAEAQAAPAEAAEGAAAERRRLNVVGDAAAAGG
jgi:hypothetical protein